MPSLLLHDATLIDGTGTGPRPHTRVLVEGDTIRRGAPWGGRAASRWSISAG